MGRGGADKERSGPERRCIVTGDSGPTARLIRFVLDPDGVVTPDLAEKLPGRGVWLTADAEAVATALKKRLFNRAFRRDVTVSSELNEQLISLLIKRSIEALALCRKAGVAVAGFEKVRDALTRAEYDGPDGEERARGVVLLQAYDGAMDGRRKLARHLPPDAIVTTLNSDEMGLAFGRDYVIHALLTEGGAAKRALREFQRLEGLRGARSASEPQSRDAGSGDAIQRPDQA